LGLGKQKNATNKNRIKTPSEKPWPQKPGFFDRKSIGAAIPFNDKEQNDEQTIEHLFYKEFRKLHGRFTP
jgi:hypothetical protein